MDNTVDFFFLQTHRDEYFLFSEDLKDIDLSGFIDFFGPVFCVQQVGSYAYMIRTNNVKRDTFLKQLRSFLAMFCEALVSDLQTVYGVCEFYANVGKDGRSGEHFEQPSLI